MTLQEAIITLKDLIDINYDYDPGGEGAYVDDLYTEDAIAIQVLIKHVEGEK